ncbi:MAG: response regulator [Spirochaetales bacterium]|nr:response regulator [Spirochaetales bacterium]
MELIQLNTILLIEDNEDHIEHTLDALHEVGLVKDIKVVQDGEEAIQYLYREGKYSNPLNSPRPDLILLDVKLPKLNGFEILKRIKNDPDLRVIPVILLTTTGKKEDIDKGARLGTNDYIVKPVEYEIFIQKVKGLGKYWALISNLTT